MKKTVRKLRKVCGTFSRKVGLILCEFSENFMKIWREIWGKFYEISI